MDNEEVLKRLQEPFDSLDIDWRVQASGFNGSDPWMRVVPYITNRAIQKRLDDIFGVFGWQDEYKETDGGKGMLCGITIFDPDDRTISVTKWDGAEIPQFNPDSKQKIDPIKTALSNSEKRTGSTLGIGRYLYQLEMVYAKCKVIESRRECDDEYKNDQNVLLGSNWMKVAWANPPLPEWALPHVDFEEFIKPMLEAEKLEDLRFAYEDAYKKAEATGDKKNSERVQEVKNRVKDSILATLVDEQILNLKNLVIWLDLQIEGFQLVPNASAVNLMHGVVKTELITRARALMLDEKPLIKTLHRSRKHRLKELERNQQEIRND